MPALMKVVMRCSEVVTPIPALNKALLTELCAGRHRTRCRMAWFHLDVQLSCANLCGWGRKQIRRPTLIQQGYLASVPTSDLQQQSNTPTRI